MAISPITGAAQSAQLQQSQRRRKNVLRVAAVLGVVLVLLTDSGWRASAPTVFAWLQRLGFLLVLSCIFGRTWCTLYIGGRKKLALTMAGPYSIVRNPLYVFTLVGVTGAGLLAGSVTIALLFGALALLVFHVVTREEEAFLADAFGDAFAAYAARVPRFWPRFSLWRDAHELVVRPKLVVRTFFDTSLFLLTVPLMDLRDWLQGIGVLPVWLYLP